MCFRFLQVNMDSDREECFSCVLISTSIHTILRIASPGPSVHRGWAVLTLNIQEDGFVHGEGREAFVTGHAGQTFAVVFGRRHKVQVQFGETFVDDCIAGRVQRSAILEPGELGRWSRASWFANDFIMNADIHHFVGVDYLHFFGSLWKRSEQSLAMQRRASVFSK